MSVTKIPFEDGTDDYSLSCDDCGAYVVSGNAEDIEHYDSCIPTHIHDDLYNDTISPA